MAVLHSHGDAEAYRTLRTNIQFLANVRDAKALLMTSSRSGEGKSAVLANLGIVFAQSGQKVLLIDSDLRRPTLHLLFNLSNLYGLTNYLIGQCDSPPALGITDALVVSQVVDGVLFLS